MKDQLKIPSDIDDDEDYGDEDGDHIADEDQEFGAFKDAEAEENDHEEEVFALARENNEMKDHHLNEKPEKKITKEQYANPEYVERIEKIEKQMISGKSW